MGSIGKLLAKKAKSAFSMKISYFTRSPIDPLVEKELDAKKFDQLNDLLNQSDFVSVHTPLTPQTKHLFTIEQFKQMKKDSFFINTSRGAVVKEEDLAIALENDLIGGAGLDVFENEPTINERLLKLNSKITMLPHIGTETKEARSGMISLALENAVQFMKEGKSKTPVNKF